MECHGQDPTQHLIKFLQEFIAQLEEPVPLQIEYGGKTPKGEAIPIPETCHDGVCNRTGYYVKR